MNRLFHFAAIIACLTLPAGSAVAQSSLTLNIFGKVTAIDSAMIHMEQDDGAKKSVPVASGLVVFRLKPTTVADIKPNEFVASAAEPRDDGTLHSTELRIFPERLRGVGEGQRPMNDARKQVMTNATVTGPAAALGGDRVKVSFPGGDAILVIGKDVPVVRIEEAAIADVQPGQRVRLQGGADGAVSRITIQ